jgi:glycolate oxidase FAD binding subunit
MAAPEHAGYASLTVASAAARDIVDGVQARYVARPGTVEALAEAMGEAASRNETVVARGGGTKLDWGAPPSRVDLVVDLSGMNKVLEHAAGDLIVRAEPGVRLSQLQALLARTGQRLALDEVVPGSTVGGLVATGLCGPLRLGYGCARDLLIGVSVVRADGVVARSGGKVVKNVAGYDLGKLYTGSYGTLGVVAEAIFRLHPVPEAQTWVTAELSSLDEMTRCTAAVTGSQLVASALEVDCPAVGAPIALGVLVEGITVSVERRANEVIGLIGGGTISATPPGWWAAIPGETTVKLATTASDLPRVLGAVAPIAAGTGLQPCFRASAALGLAYVGLPGESDVQAVGVFVSQIRSLCEELGGSAVVLRAPGPVKQAVDIWGSVSPIRLMRRVKDSFDPLHRLAPGRFVGGI